MAILWDPISKVDIDQDFLNDVLQGLQSQPKHLSSKYFYDDNGSRIFQEIMAMPEYYLTNCEFEILSMQGRKIGKSLGMDQPFRLVELGAGDGSKTFKLIENLQAEGLSFEYLPVDVSRGALESLEEKLLESEMQVDYQLMEGDYFEVLKEIPKDKPAVYLFLGANIGNYEPEEALALMQQIANHIQPGDFLMVGFDLKKNPLLIHQAYFDPHGITKRFNINLLHRINRELGANFNADQFDFYCHYNPQNGEVRSYLVSLKTQKVCFGDGTEIQFDRFELVNTELSKKYSLEEIDNLAANAGFVMEQNFLDCQHFFTDSLWRKQ